MPESAYLLSPTPTEALRMLADLAEIGGAAYLQDVVVKVAPGLSESNVDVEVLLPDPSGYREPDARRTAPDSDYNAILARYLSDDPQIVQLPSSTEALAPQVVQLLEQSGGERETATPLESEWLLVAQGIDDVRAEAISKDLGFHATYYYLAAAEAARVSPSGSGSGSGPQTCYLFHVKDDRTRGSSFRSARSGDYFPDCQILQCYIDHGDRIFLSEAIIPGLYALESFRRIVQAAPRLFGGDSSGAAGDGGPELLIACARPLLEDSETLSQVWYLGNLNFRGSITLEPRLPQEIASFQVVSLSDSPDAIDSLQKKIEQAANDPDQILGYRLELRPVRYREWSDFEYEKLQNQLAQVEYQIAYLNSIKLPRPRLLRFTQKQLPAMADLLRSYAPTELLQSNLRYGFGVNSEHPEGLHYLLERQDIVMEEVDPLIRWEHLENHSMRFWIDPFWGRHYYRSDGGPMVFVPQGTVLSPALHTWSEADLNTHLAGLMERWFQHPQADIPKRPVFVFDGPAKFHYPVCISVMDLEDFRPLHMELGWINDNQVVAGAEEIKEFINHMATDITRRQTAEFIAASADAAESNFVKVVEETRNRLFDRTTGLTKSATDELDRLVQETQQTGATLKNIAGRLRDLAGLGETTSQAESGARRNLMGTEQQIEAVILHTNNLLRETQTQIAKVESTHTSIRQELEAKVASLTEERRELLDLVDDLVASLSESRSDPNNRN